MNKMKISVFKKGLGELCIAFSKELDKYQVMIYQQNLKSLRNEDFAKAVKFLIQNNKFFPTIAEIRSVAMDSQSDVLEAWNTFRQEIRDEGWYGVPHFKQPILRECLRYLGGWKTVCDVPHREIPFLRRDFERVFKSLKQREDIEKIQLPSLEAKKEIKEK